jgi:hypothetical protein
MRIRGEDMRQVAFIPRSDDGIHHYTWTRESLFRSTMHSRHISPGIYEGSNCSIAIPGMEGISQKTPPAGLSPIEKRIFELEQAARITGRSAETHYAVRAMQVITDAAQYDEVIVYCEAIERNDEGMAQDVVKRLFGKTKITAVTFYKDTAPGAPVKDSYVYSKGELVNKTRDAEDGITVIRSKEWGGDDVFAHLFDKYLSG